MPNPLGAAARTWGLEGVGGWLAPCESSLGDRPHCEAAHTNPDPWRQCLHVTQPPRTLPGTESVAGILTDMLEATDPFVLLYNPWD